MMMNPLSFITSLQKFDGLAFQRRPENQPRSTLLAKISLVAGLCIGAYWLLSRWQSCLAAEIPLDLSKHDLFIQTANQAGINTWKSYTTFETLVAAYPNEFQDVGQEVVAVLLHQQFGGLADTLSGKLKALGNPLDTYHELWLKITKKEDLDAAFEARFDSLSENEQKTLIEMSFNSLSAFDWFVKSPHKDKLLAVVFSLDAQGTPRLFYLQPYALTELIKNGSTERLNLLEVIDPISGKNILTHVATIKNLDDQTRSQILAHLINEHPSTYGCAANEVVEALLLQGHRQVASNLVKAIEKQGTKLDAYHSLWLKVAEQTKPDAAFKTQFSLLTASQKKTLYEAAFHYHNVFVSEPVKIPVPPSYYSINLMWIDKARNENQENLFPTLAEQTHFCWLVDRWATLNPETTLTIWVDEEMSTSKAIENVKQVLNKSLGSQKAQQVYFRNVRSIDLIQQNQEVFSEKMPIYFRVELLRTIVADHVLRQKEVQYFVYTDLDVEPFSNEELFDKRTMDHLETMGFVMAKGEGTVPYENSFLILNGEHEQLMRSHRKVLIDQSIAMAKRGPSAVLEQQVYFTYRTMLTHLLEATGLYGNIKPFKGCLTGSSGKLPLECYRFDRFPYDPYNLRFEQHPSLTFKDLMPQKPVLAPPSHFYNS